MKEFINHKVKVNTKDKSYFLGTLIALDKTGNLILDDTEEYYKKTEKRHLGLILLRSTLIISLECLYKMPADNKKTLKERI